MPNIANAHQNVEPIASGILANDPNAGAGDDRDAVTKNFEKWIAKFTAVLDGIGALDPSKNPNIQRDKEQLTQLLQLFKKTFTQYQQTCDGKMPVDPGSYIANAEKVSAFMKDSNWQQADALEQKEKFKFSIDDFEKVMDSGDVNAAISYADPLMDYFLVQIERVNLLTGQLQSATRVMKQKNDAQALNLDISNAAKAVLNKMDPDGKMTDKIDKDSAEGQALKLALSKVPGGDAVWDALDDRADLTDLSNKIDTKTQEFATDSQRDQLNLSRLQQQLETATTAASDVLAKMTQLLQSIISKMTQ